MPPRAGLDRATVVRAAATLSNVGEDLTLAALAAHLGVRTPSLYNHVDGQEGLHRELALFGVRELSARITRAAVGRSAGDALKAVAQGYRDYAREHPGVYRYTQRAPDADDEELQVAAAEVVDVLTAVMSAFELRNDEAIHAIRGLRSLLHGFVALELNGGFGLDVDQDASFDFAVTAFVAGLEAGIWATEPSSG